MSIVPPLPSYKRLAGKMAIVTGAGSVGGGLGTGKAIACLFAAEGARLALLDLDPARVEDTRVAIAAAGGRAFVSIGDVTRPDDCARMVAESVAQLGGLDILVNNVGVGTGAARLEGADPAVWATGIDLNLNSAFLMTRSAVPHLLAGKSPAIVNIGSVAGMRAHGAAGSYGPAKAALAQFTAELAVIYGAEGLRANLVAPGHIMTPMVEQFATAAKRDNRRQIAPLSAIEGNAWDVAYAALFLAGPESRFITAMCLPVDGGVTAISPLAAHERMVSGSMTH